MSVLFRSLRQLRRARTQRHSAEHLFYRGVMATVGGAAMATGFYPVAPAVLLRIARRGGPRSPFTARRVFVEWALGVASSASRPLGFLGMPRGEGGPRPVVFVHGYVMSRSCFSLLARRLGEAGLGPFFGFEYWTLGKVSSAARKLSEFVDVVRQRTGADQVDLVCHSMGGVVARYYVALAGGETSVAHVVTIGSPHQGTDVSGFGVGRPQVELLPGSALISRLESAAWPSQVDLVTIWSQADALVWSSRQARIPGATEIRYEDLGHLGLLASRRVASDVTRILSAPGRL